MKKWILALTLAGGVLALSACNQSGSDTVAESKVGNVTQEELYNTMKESTEIKPFSSLYMKKFFLRNTKLRIRN